MALRIEMLTPARVEELWTDLEPLFDVSCKSNPVGETDITSQIIYDLTQSDQAVIFAAFNEHKVTTVMAIQFTDTYGRKGVDIIALAGRNLLRFKAAFWQPILDWFKANNVEFVSAYGTPELARMYMKKFGFNLSCTYVRMVL